MSDPDKKRIEPCWTCGSLISFFVDEDGTPHDILTISQPNYCRYPDGSWHLIEQHGDEVHVDGVAYFRLDEERLARAMMKASEYQSSGHGQPPRTLHRVLHPDKKDAAAIAKAYREDTDG